MARNHEKQYGKLNRLILQKEKADLAEKRPRRPKLSTLHTVDEIKKWLPGIKEDIDFHLKQSEVTCYSDAKIEDLQKTVLRLEREYKRFVGKIKQLDGDLESVPWTNRPYERRQVKSPVDAGVSKSSDGMLPIHTPILDEDNLMVANAMSPEVTNVPHLVREDEPLNFEETFHQDQLKYRLNCQAISEKKYAEVCLNRKQTEAIQTTTSKLCKVFGIEDSDITTELGVDITRTSSYTSPGCTSEDKSNDGLSSSTASAICGKKMETGRVLLGIDYSSSDEES